MIRRYLPVFVVFLLAVCSFSCKKKDANPPVVTLEGSESIQLALNSSYVEQGATATDAEDGALEVSIGGEVDVNFAGTYIITYLATDNAGNSGSAIRIVRVFNQSDNLSGDFSYTGTSATDTNSFNAIITTSTTVNNRIWIEGYALSPQAVVYADVTGDQLNIPKQECQIAGQMHYFSGQGQYNTIDSLKIMTVFRDSSSLGIINGNGLYIIKN
jgi:hypothetical protein